MRNEFKALERRAYQLLPDIIDYLSISFSNLNGRIFYKVFVFSKTRSEVKNFDNINDAINYIEHQEILKRKF